MTIEVKDSSHSRRGGQLFKAIADELIHKGFSISEDGRVLYYNGISNDTRISRYINIRQIIHFLRGEMSFSKRASFSDLTERGFYLDPSLVTVNQSS